MINLSSVLEVATATHPGMVRSHNEDSLAADAGVGLAVLADGSEVAVKVLRPGVERAIAKDAWHGRP